jgi:hypothetical protein
MEVLQDPTPALGPAPKPAERMPKRCVHLTVELKICLVKLCVENQADFQVGKKMQFWATMSELLQQEAGIHLKDSAGNISNI